MEIESAESKRIVCGCYVGSIGSRVKKGAAPKNRPFLRETGVAARMILRSF